MKIYYAHHIWKYGTPIETFEMSVIKNGFDFEDGFQEKTFWLDNNIVKAFRRGGK